MKTNEDLKAMTEDSIKPTTILLHMGIHKTGSTSLQKTFAAYRAELARDGIAFLGPDRPYRCLYSGFLSDPMAFVWNRTSGKSETAIRERDRTDLDSLRQSLIRHRGQTVILSNEYLPKLSLLEMTALREFLAAYGEVRAVYYYRELHSWMASNSQQMAKAGITTEPTPFTLALRRVHSLPLRVASVFGKENATFIRFEDAVINGICETFLTHFGLPSLSRRGLKEIKANTAISDQAVRALYVYNRDHPVGSANRDRVEVERLKALPGERYQLDGFDPVDIKTYAAARQEVEAQLGLTLAAPEILPVQALPTHIHLRRLAGRIKRRLLSSSRS